MLKLFSGKKKQAQDFLREIISELLEGGGFLLSFQVEKDKDQEGLFRVDIFGEDEGLLKTKGGRLLLAFQTYLFLVLCNKFPGEKLQLIVDSNGYWEERESRLMSLTDHLIKKALDTNKPVLFKQTLSPSQRRLIHKKVSGNTGVRSQSYGTGLYKSMKLIPDTFKSGK